MKKFLLFLFAFLAGLPFLYSQNNIKGYQYWFDNNISAGNTVSVSSGAIYNLNTTISANSLSAGLHTFNVRFIDDSSRYSSVAITNFFKNTIADVTGYEYWFDGNYAGKTSQALSPAVTGSVNTPISTGSILPGLHTFNIRFCDGNGLWSSTQIQYFYKTQSGNITAYQYWVDNNYAGNTTQSASSSVSEIVNTPLAAGSLTPGLHVFNIRFMDNYGVWSSVQMQSFTVNNTSSKIVSYRYWYDSVFTTNNTYSLPVSATIDSLKTALAIKADSGKHAMHIQFEDNTGLWSSFTTDTFYKNSKAGIAAVSPDSGSNYSIDTVIITGNGFTDSAAVKLTYIGQTDITPSYFQYLNENELKVALNLNGKKPGLWNLVVTIPHDTVMTVDSAFLIYNGIFITGAIDTLYQASQSVTVHYTVPYPFNTGNIFTLQILNTLNKLAKPLNIGAVSATDSGSITAMLPANLPASCGYQFRVVGSSPNVASLPSTLFAIEDIIAPNGDYALQFNGTSAFLDMGTWFNQDSFTVSFWVNPDSTQGSGAAVFNIQNNLAFFYNDDNHQPNNYVLFNNLRQDLLPSQWNQVTISVNNTTGVRKLYLFGQLVKQSILTFSPVAGYDMRLGNWTWNGLFGNTYWKGLIDEVKIFNYPLSDSAVLDNVNKELTGNEPGLLAYWNFNDGQCASVSFDKTKNHRPAYLDSGLVRVPSTVPNIGQQVIPNYGGNTDDITVSVYGAGFVPGATAKFSRKGFPDVHADSVYVSTDGSIANCWFDLEGADTGLYDVVISNPDTTVYTYPRSFTIQQGTLPDVWINLIGKNVVTQGADNTVLIVYGNNGNVAAKGIPLYFAVSDTTTQVELLFKELRSADSLSIDSVFDSLPIYTIVDTLFGEPFSGKFYSFFIPVIQPNVMGYLAIKIKTANGSTAPVEIQAWTDSAMFLTDPDLYDKDGISPLANAQVDCIKGLVDDAFIAIGTAFPPAGCVYGAVNGFFWPVVKTVLDPNSPQAIDNYSKAFWSIGKAIGKTLVGCASALKLLDKVQQIGFVSTLASKFSQGSGGGGALTPIISAIKDNKDELGNIYKIIKGASKAYPCAQKLPVELAKRQILDQRQVGSEDPNYKIGPSKYIKSNEQFNYTIGFENSPTATAPAQNVVIIDTLDKKSFNLNTFTFGIFGWGDSLYTPTYPLQKSFITQYNYISKDSLVIQVRARLDTSSGVVRWQFTSLDPVTLQPTENPLRGFLPADTGADVGKGFVNYNIKLKPGIGTNAPINNAATIYFDYNAPISTKTYKNVVDNTPPYSAVNPIVLTNDTVLNVSWSGTDTGSGIKYYNIYYTDNNDTFYNLLQNTDSTHIILYGQVNHTYQFFSLATDSAGNVETDTLPIRSITLTPTTISSISSSIFELKNIPNPFKDECTIEFTLPEELNINLTVNDLYGNVISTVAQGDFNQGHYSYNFKSNNLSAGVYFIQLNTEKGVYYSKMVIEK